MLAASCRTVSICVSVLTTYVVQILGCPPGGCYELCKLACASTLVPFAVDAVVVLCP